MDVVFPVETIVRELDFRLAAAVHFARRGRRVFVAESSFSHRMVDQLRDGLYVGKHVFQARAGQSGPLVYHAAKKRGFRVVHLSEEGAVYTGGVDSWRRVLSLQLDPGVLAPEDFICTWGDFQRDYYASFHPPCEPHIRTTGHPRFDLYREPYVGLYDRRAEALRRTYGRFVLLNTNFAATTHPAGPGYVFSRSLGYRAEDADTRRWFVGLWSRTARSTAHHVELLHRLSIERPEVSFVVRPHPSDDLAFFRAAFAEVPNVHVVREGPVTPWLRAAAVLLHDGCTTALEAHLLDTPVVTFSPEPTPDHTPYLPSLVGVTVHDQDAAARAVWDAYDGALPAAKGATFGPLARSALANLSHDAFPPFLSVLEEASAAGVRGGHEAPPVAMLADLRLTEAKETAKRVVRRFGRGARLAGHMRGLFPGFDRAYVSEVLDYVQRAIGRRVDATFHGPRLIEIRSDARD